MLLDTTKQLMGSDVFYNCCDGSLEAINFQVNSAFPKELTNVINMCFEFARRYDEKYGKINNPGEAALKYSRFREYFLKEVAPIFKKTITKYTGFTVNELTVCTPKDFNGVLGFWMQIANPEEELEEIVSLYYKSEGTNFKSSKVGDLTDNIIKMSESLDKKTGKLSDNNALKININVPLGAFCITDIITKDLNFKPEEIVAIFMHEIGHIMTIIEYMKDSMYLGYFGNNSLRDIKELVKNDPKKTISEIKKMSSEIEKRDKEKKYAKFTNVSKKLVDKIEPYLNDIENIDESGEYKSGIPSFLILSILFYLTLYSMIIFNILCLFGTREFIMINKESVDKFMTRDIATNKNTSLLERLADEYVSRYQMGKYLNSGLINSYRIADEIEKIPSMKPVFNKAIRDSRFLRFVSVTVRSPFIIINYLINLKIDGVTSEYEEINTRLRRNINNLHDVLKQRDIPDNIKQSILNDIDYMENALSHNRSRFEFNAIEKTLRFILEILPKTLEKGINIFSKNNPYKEYTQLFEYLDDMLSNKSFYYSNRIKFLINSK
jgi:hypothetical protein